MRGSIHSLLSRGSLACVLLVLPGCGAGASPAPAPTCDTSCQDGVALRGVRETMKLAYNLLIQGKPVGAQDGRSPCRSFDGSTGGSVHVFGTATANAVQGSTFVELEYDFDACAYSAPPDIAAEQNYNLVSSGRVRQRGTLAVQPTSTTALLIDADGLTVSGTVYDPPIEYGADACALDVAQQGSTISGTWCGRNAGFMF